MKKVITLLFFFTALLTNAQDKKIISKSKLVEVSCGKCKFGLKSYSCDLAVRIDGKSYFISGTKIEGHDDAHTKDGFCNVVRKAEVIGEIINNRFVATHFKLLPVIE